MNRNMIATVIYIIAIATLIVLLALLVAALPKDTGAQIQVTPVPDALCIEPPVVVIDDNPCIDGHKLVIMGCLTGQPITRHIVFWDDVIACSSEADLPQTANLLFSPILLRGRLRTEV